MKSTPANRWRRAIQPAIRFCARTPGAKSAIIAKLNRIAPPDHGRPWTRQQVESYLHADPARRHEPGAGAGLALMEAAGAVMLASQKQALRMEARGEREL